MSYLADAHRDWHTVHGQNVVCPLDCGAGEDYDYPMDNEPHDSIEVYLPDPIPEYLVARDDDVDEEAEEEALREEMEVASTWASTRRDIF